MTLMHNNKPAELIEQLVDQHNVNDVLMYLGQVCSAKAEHIRTNWQDDPTANFWLKAAAQIRLCRDSLPMVQGIKGKP